MKYLILIFVAFISFTLFAQNDSNDASAKDETEWIAKISSDSEMRVLMMDMIIVNTKGNKEEMMKIVNSISNDPELYQMIVQSYPEKANSENISIEALGIGKDSIKVGVMNGTQTVPKPKQ